MKKISLILIIFSFAFFLSSCESEEQELSTIQTNELAIAKSNEKSTQTKEYSLEGMSADIKKIVEKGELTIALTAEDLKGFYEDKGNGKLEGIDIELGRNIAEALGVEAVFDRSADSHEQLTKKLVNDEVDVVIATYSSTLERSMYVLQSDTYFKSNMGVCVNKQFLLKNKIQNSPVEFMKKNPFNLCVLKGSSHITFARSKFPYCNIIEVDDDKEGCEKVVSGEADAFLSSEAELIFSYDKNKTLPIYADVFTFSDIQDNFCVGISRNSPQLLNFINAYIANQKQITVKEVEEILDEQDDTKPL